MVSYKALNTFSKKNQQSHAVFPRTVHLLDEYTKEIYTYNLLIPRLNFYFSMGKFPKQRLCLRKQGLYIIIYMLFTVFLNQLIHIRITQILCLGKALARFLFLLHL